MEICKLSIVSPFEDVAKNKFPQILFDTVCNSITLVTLFQNVPSHKISSGHQSVFAYHLIMGKSFFSYGTASLEHKRKMDVTLYSDQKQQKNILEE